MGSSGNNSSLRSISSRFGKQALIGGLTRSLNRKVPYTSSAKPRTCSHLKLSQPSPSETIQMNNVRQVSMIDLDVAEMARVTERPKKLNPPMDIMIKTLDTAIARFDRTWRYPSCASK